MIIIVQHAVRVAMERGGVISEPRVTWAVETEDVDYLANRAALARA